MHDNTRRRFLGLATAGALAVAGCLGGDDSTDDDSADDASAAGSSGTDDGADGSDSTDETGADDDTTTDGGCAVPDVDRLEEMLPPEEYPFDGVRAISENHYGTGDFTAEEILYDETHEADSYAYAAAALRWSFLPSPGHVERDLPDVSPGDTSAVYAYVIVDDHSFSAGAPDEERALELLSLFPGVGEACLEEATVFEPE